MVEAFVAAKGKSSLSRATSHLARWIFCLVTFYVEPVFETTGATEHEQRSAPSEAYISTYVGTGIPGNAEEKTPRRQAAIAEPYGLVSDRQGNLYFSDYENNLVRRVDAGSGIVTTVAEVPAPQGLALDGNGSIYVGSIQSAVWRVELDSGRSVVVAGGGTKQVVSGPATDIALVSPTGVAADSTGNIYISDDKLHAVFRLVPSRQELAIVAGQRGEAGFAGDGGLATRALLNGPADVEVDDAGNLYIADADNHVVRIVDAQSNVINTLAGMPETKGYSGDGSPGGVRFNWPQALLLAEERTLLVADLHNHRIRQIDLDSRLVTTFAGSGSNEFAGENLLKSEGSLPYAVGLAAGPSGALYVSSPLEHRIFKIGAPSIIPTQWWQSHWVWFFAGLLFIALFKAIVEGQKRRLRARARTLEVAVESRTADLANQYAVIEQQAKRLKELVEAKNELVQRISHEFRTPLTLILSPIARLYASVQSDAERKYLETTERNASRLLRLVDQMIDLTIDQHVREEGNLTNAHLAPIITEVTASFSPLAEEHGTSLTENLCEDLVVKSSPQTVETIAVNLISNAIKYSTASGEIRVSTSSEGGLAVISVSDKGCGISADQLDRIFEPFHRAHDEAERIPGSGLGLTLVRELVERDGGRIEVESQAGAGSKFRVFLPVAEEESYELPARQLGELARIEASAISSPGRLEVLDEITDSDLPTVLVVEDNADMLCYLLDILSGQYRCLWTDNGESAIFLANDEIPDVVVTDIMLPGYDGYSLCAKLKNDHRTSHIPVILLTALDDVESRIQGLAARADDYVAKPFTESELLQRLENLRESRSMLRARYSRDLRFDLATPADMDSRDRTFLEKLARWLGSHYQNPHLTLEAMAAEMSLSTRQLQRKLKGLVGLGPSEFLRDYRLQRAHEHLVAGTRPGAVALKCGFASHSHFTARFRAQFGYPPSKARQIARLRS